MRLTIALIALASSSSFARADCAVQSVAARPHLVELYTSEGCSSCPPADAWLRNLPHDGNVAALAFHVDYWDSLGWRDRFSSPDYSARQQMQARRDGAKGVYTPQVVLDGRPWPDWYRHAAPATSAPANASMSLQAVLGPKLRAQVTTAFDRASAAAGYWNFVALVEDGLASEVRAGENRGVRLRHDHVVRAFAGPLALRADAELDVPADVDLARARLVAFAQNEHDGAVGQVVSLPLAACR